MSFTQKRIDVTFSAGQTQKFDGSATMTGKRVIAKCIKPIGSTMSTIELAIYGMTLSDMNRFSAGVGTTFDKVNNNSIKVEAGDENGMSLMFQGTYVLAYMDGQSQPQVCFRVTGHAGLYEAVKSIPPTSIQGSGDADKMLKDVAGQMGLTYEGTGVDTKLSNPYVWGTGREQALKICEAAGLLWTIDLGTLAVWKPGQSRPGGGALISPQTGMRGYPSFNQASVIVECLFKPEIKVGQQIQIQSDIQPACGTWNVINIKYDLESEVPNGKWFMTIEAVQGGSPFEGS